MIYFLAQKPENAVITNKETNDSFTNTPNDTIMMIQQ